MIFFMENNILIKQTSRNKRLPKARTRETVLLFGKKNNFRGHDCSLNRCQDRWGFGEGNCMTCHWFLYHYFTNT